MMITETAASAVLAGGGGGKIKRSSFKSRSGSGASINGVGNGGGSFRGYRAVRVTVPSTVVADLASKFNAVVVDADRGATARDIIKKVNKTLSKGAAVRATVEKFESAAKKKPYAGGGTAGGNHLVVVRTNSDQRTAAVAGATQLRPSSLSIVKRRMEQFQNDKKPQKPSVLAPKPNLTAGPRSEERSPRYQKVSATTKTDVQSAGGRQSPPHQKVTAMTTVVQSVDGRLPNKHKRLSIARDPDAQLESVLNVTAPQTDVPRPAEAKRRLSPPKIQPKPNSSFLHGLKRPTSDTLPGSVEKSREVEPQQPLEPQPLQAHGAANFLQTHKKKMTADDDYNYIRERHQAIYEELCDTKTPSANPLPPLPDVVLTNSYYDDGTNDHHYTTIDGGEQNIYDDVITATAVITRESRKRPADDEDGSYETVQAPLSLLLPPPPPPPLPQPQVVPVTVVMSSSSPTPLLPADDGDSDGGNSQERIEVSDSWMEVDNSIYGMNTPSDSASSSGVASDSVSGDRNSKLDLDEEWIDVDNTSDELQEIIVFRQKPKIDTITNGWSIQVQKQLTKAYVSISSQSVISFIKDVPEQINYKKNQCDFLSEQLLSVVLKTVFLEEKFELQELSLFVDNEIKEKTNALNQEIPEDIYVDYDSFESDDSWDDCKDGEKLKRVPYPCENRDLPAPPCQQNIYGLVPLVKRAGNRMKKRWSLGSLGLNRIRKLSGNLTTDFGNRNFDNVSEKSIDKKLIPSMKCKSLSSSIFYLNDPIYNNIENGQIYTPVRNASKPPSSIDSRRLSVARPSSPPPPPPVNRHPTGNNGFDSLPRSICNSKGRPGTVFNKSNTESVSENDSNQGSDLYIRFADEPLYQFYAADLSVRTKTVFADDTMEECDGYEEISSITSRPSALELITPCLTGHGQLRSLWCEVPEVKHSGIIDTLKPRERKLQEAKFELITSEASYFKSLTVLEKHFVNSHSMNDETILCKNDRKILFGNVNAVRKCSEKLLAALEKCWQDNILLGGLCEILYTHSKENFDIFVKYCSNQIYIDRTLKLLKEKNLKFNEALQRLESDSKCQSLSLHSFLMLPMQRITRLPLLVDAILSQMNSTENSLEYQMCELTLASLNTIVQNCNESTRKLERYEEMLLLSQQLEFSSKKEIKAMSVASSSRWLVRSGSMLHLTSPDAKLTFSRKLIRPTKLYFFLFNDMFFIAKRKSDENYTVVDYCARNFVQMVDATELVITSSYKNLLMLTILENHEAKTVEMLLSCDSESSKKRWIEAMSPPISSNPDETLYNEWDCPQVYSEHAYTAVQPDELSLQIGDIVKVLTKMNDGWYHGERIRDGEKGWFPGNYTSEIASQHARAKNLKQRYRLLAMSGSYLQSQQDKIKKK